MSGGYWKHAAGEKWKFSLLCRGGANFRGEPRSQLGPVSHTTWVINVHRAYTRAHPAVSNSEGRELGLVAHLG